MMDLWNRGTVAIIVVMSTTRSSCDSLPLTRRKASVSTTRSFEGVEDNNDSYRYDSAQCVDRTYSDHAIGEHQTLDCDRRNDRDLTRLGAVLHRGPANDVDHGVDNRKM